MVADMLAGWAEVGFIVLASVVAKYLYIVLVLEHTTQTEPYLLAGIACALLFRHFQWNRGLSEIAVLQQGARQWRSVLGSLLLAFLVLIATAYVFKLSTLFSRGWLITWFMLACAMLVVWAEHSTATSCCRWQRPVDSNVAWPLLALEALPRVCCRPSSESRVRGWLAPS